MSKDRLEEVRNRMIVEKQHFKYLNSEKGYWENVYTLLEQDMKYLFDTIIEQAERVQELEDEIKTHASHGRNYTNEQYVELRMENKRYREALEFYADDDKWYEVNKGSPYMPDYRREIEDDMGEVARKALEEIE